MNRRSTVTFVLCTALAAPALVGCANDGEVVDRDQNIEVSPDGTTATQSRSRTRETSSGATVKETESRTREVVQPAPGSTPDATQKDASK